MEKRKQKLFKRKAIARMEVKMKEKDTFEGKIKELEDIAKKLESGELNLDESMKEFENGMKLSKECTKILDDAEKKIMILINEDGNLKEEKYDTDEE